MPADADRAVVIAPFRKQYEAALIALITGIQRNEFGIPISAAEQPDLLDVEGCYQRGTGGFWIALRGGRLLGSIGLLDIGERQAALRKMFVAADSRGPGDGAVHTPVAARLLEVLLAHARAQQLRDIFLGTTASFRAAHRFYEKHGFAGVERETLPASFPLMTVDSRFYHLALP